MQRRAFLHNLSIGIVATPLLACADAAGSRQREQIEIIVHLEPT